MRLVNNWQYLLVLSLFIPLLNACGDTTKNYSEPKYYVAKDDFSKGRPCDEVLFKCLPESQQKAWQQIDPSDKTLIENYQPTKEDIAIRQQVIDADDTMKITKSMMESFERIEHKRFIEKQAEDLEKEFPNFWRDVPNPVRYRWVKRAISKANKYGYDGEVTDSIQMIELCARIGLDFDLDPKWEAITKFITMPKASIRGYAGGAVEYLDFTIFEKNHAIGGDPITDWSMKTALRYLPYPKRKVPRLND